MTSKPKSKPDTDEGWFKLAYTLLPALLMARPRIEAVVVACEVLAQNYGPGKYPWASLSPKAIAARSGLKRENIWRGIRQLLDAGILLANPDRAHEYRFNKYFTEWTDGSETRIPDHLAQYVADFAALTRSYKPPKPPGQHPAGVSTVDTPSETPDTFGVSTLDTPSAPVDGCGVSTADTRGVSTVDTLGVPPSPVPLSPGEKKRNTRAHPNRVREEENPLPTSDDREPFEPPSPPSGSNIPDIPDEISGPGPDDPEAQALIVWARTLGTDGNGEPYAEWVRATCPFCPVAWLRVLLERRVLGRSGRGRAAIPLLAHLIGKARQEREPPYPVGFVPGGNGNGTGAPATIPLNRIQQQRADYQAKLDRKLAEALARERAETLTEHA